MYICIDTAAYHDKPFIEFLRARHLSHNLQHFVLYAIAMKTEDTPTKEVQSCCSSSNAAIVTNLFLGFKGLSTIPTVIRPLWQHTIFMDIIWRR